MLKMSTSIAQSRQQLSALNAAAQQQPQVITNRNTPVAVLFSPEYFARTEAAIAPDSETFYSQLVQLRETFAPVDNSGIGESASDTRQPECLATCQPFCLRLTMYGPTVLANTNVINEFVKRTPDAQVMQWLQTVQRLFISAVTLEEAHLELA